MNLWSRFQALLGGNTPILVGTCVDAEWGYCTIELPGGSQLTVEGAGTIGNRYFITQKSDLTWRLDGQASSLPLLTIEI